MVTDQASRRAAQEISNAITRLHRDHVGRGPNSVRTMIGHDYVICILEDVYTQVERTLIVAGEQAAVRASREAFQRAMGPQFIAVVEQNTDRKVRAFLSQVSFDPDLSTEVFALEPNREDPAPDGVA